MSLYHEAAEALTASTSEGGSLKSRIFGNKKLKSPPSQLYALVVETRKWSGVLKEVVENAQVLRHERKLTPSLALLLVHDLLLAKGGIALPQSHGLRVGVERHKNRLTSELTRARLRRKAPSLDTLREQIDRDSAGEEANYPRWVRVNAIKSTLEEQLETTFKGYERANTVEEVVQRGGGSRRILIDVHVPNLIAVTPGIDLTKTEAYAAGKIILQDKASCFPAYLLDPRSEDGDVVDACAAPGNKTTHLAAILHEHRPEFQAPPQTIFAFEKDGRRAQTLEKMITIAGSKKTTRVGFGQDFTRTDPLGDKFKAVGALLLDPSCSGSGIVGRDSLPDLHLPSAFDATNSKNLTSKKLPAKSTPADNKRKRKHEEVESEDAKTLVDDDGNETVLKHEKDYNARLDALAAFQKELLLHAFAFTSATKISYSTCSVHAQENENVVIHALGTDLAKTRGWRILRRDEQVSGMRDWPVRGVSEASNGNEEVSQGCIRSYKDDGRGVMGFFVACFVRDPSIATEAQEAVEEPYIRDEDGKIIRDLTGMPVSKATGLPVELHPADEDEHEGLEKTEEDGSDTGSTSDDASEDGDDGWEGFGA